MTVATDNAKVRAVQYIANYVAESTKRSIDQQSRAMAEAARTAVGAEFGLTVRQLQQVVREIVAERDRRWEAWLTHAAALAIGAGLCWVGIFGWWHR